MQQTPADREQLNFPPLTTRGFAIVQLLIGVFCMVIGIVAVSLYRVSYWFSSVTLATATGALEIWTPIFFIVAGILGIIASINRTSGPIIAHLVLCILSSVMSFVLFVDGAIYGWQLWTHKILAVAGFAEFVFSITSAVLCCKALCCRGNVHTGTVIHGQTMVVTSTQPGLGTMSGYYPTQTILHVPVTTTLGGTYYSPSGVHPDYSYACPPIAPNADNLPYGYGQQFGAIAPTAPPYSAPGYEESCLTDDQPPQYKT